MRTRCIASERRARPPLQHNDFAFAVSDGMGGAMAGEFASRIAVEKITTLLPRSYKLSAQGIDCGHRRCAGGTFRSDSQGAGLCREQLRRVPRHGDHAEPVLVHAGLDVFRPRGRQPDLFLSAARQAASSNSARTTRTSRGFCAMGTSRNGKRARTRGATCSRNRSAAATNSWIRRSARWPTSRAICSCFARMD